jgi:hypothetical protein
LKFYRDQQPPWLFTQNYIEFSLGRQAYTLGESDLAVEHFARLLRRGMGSDGQGDVLEDFVLAYQVGLFDKGERLELKLDDGSFHAATTKQAGIQGSPFSNQLAHPDL